MSSTVIETLNTFHANSPTEQAGAFKAGKNSNSIRQHIFELLTAVPMTDEELLKAYVTKYGPQREFFRNTLIRRRLELKSAGAVKDSGNKRLSTSNVPNIVWMANSVN